MEINNEQFTGPVFILGLPRSGTKLLRDLLNRNPKISILTTETWFFPYMIKKYGYDINLNQRSCMKKFSHEVTKTDFYRRMHQKGYSICMEDLDNIEDKRSWASIFEYLMRFFAEKKEGKYLICGDKTPGYTDHIELLHNIFPKSRFIHIIRDPRDRALSSNKLWRTSLCRSAVRWSESIEGCRREVKRKGIKYLELYYEELLEEPQKFLKDICGFLECSFSEDMLSLETPSDHIGDAKGQTRIVSGNKGKYTKQLSAADIKRIEEIAWPVLRTTPYKVHFAQQHRPLNRWLVKVLRLYDGCALLIHDMKANGMVRGVKLFYMFHVKK